MDKETAARAHALSMELDTLILNREEALLNAAIMAYRSGRLTGDDARGVVAELTAMRRLSQDMKDQYKRAIEETMEEFNGRREN